MDVYTYYYYQGRANIILRHILTYILLLVVPICGTVYSVLTKSESYLKITLSLLGCGALLCLITGIYKFIKFSRVKARFNIDDVSRMEWPQLVVSIHQKMNTPVEDILVQITQKETLYTTLYNSGIRLPFRDYGLWLFDLIFNLIQNDGTLRLDNWRLRSIWIPVLAIMMTPLSLVYVIVKHISSAFNMIQTTPSLMSARVWKPVDLYKFRDLNEVDHLFEARLAKAYVISEEIFETTASPVYSTLATICFVIIGSVCLPVGYLILIPHESISNSLVIAMFTGLITGLNLCSKIISTKKHLPVESERITELSNLLHLPITTLREATDLLNQTTEYRIVGWIRDLIDVVAAPWYLLISRYYLYKVAEFISEHIDESADPKSLITIKLPDYKLDQSKLGESIYYDSVDDRPLYIPPPYNPHNI